MVMETLSPYLVHYYSSMKRSVPLVEERQVHIVKAPNVITI